MSRAVVKLTSRDWFPKAAAGLILGFTLAIGLCGLFAWFGPGGHWGGTGKTQLTMWLVAPLWCGVLSFVFLFRSGLRAWLGLGAANLLVFGLLWGGRLLLA